MSHAHPFDESHWPFAVPVNTAVITTRQVIDGLPILQVYHDADGDWQFLCGTTNDPQDAKVVCLGCVIGWEPALAQLADMPAEWLAHRASAGQPWARTPCPTIE